jgi:hypothetical protein
MDKAAELKDLQTRQKALTAQRDQIIRDQGIQERKLEEIYAQLRVLGIESPELLSPEELMELSEDLKQKLEVKITTMAGLLQKGEALLAQYQEV